MVDSLEQVFPRLVGSQYRLTSPKSEVYNCIAWAAGDPACWWWPEADDFEGIYWPPGVPRLETIPAFREVFETLGYTVYDQEQPESGFEKIALFAHDQLPTHAARQLPSGKWTSKLGPMEDIEHDLHDLEGDAYGSVVLIMKRPTAAE